MVRLLSLIVSLFSAAVAFAQTAECPEGRAGWVSDKYSSCKIWSYCPRPEMSVTWSGACVDGFAEGPGVKQWFQGAMLSDRYEGNMRAGKTDGRGVDTFATGDRYEGEFRNDERNGRGVLFYANGDRYQGEFRSGTFNGRGIFIWANRDCRGGDRRNCQGVDNPAVWYEGEFLDGEFTGHGIMLFSNGDWYKGEWRDGRPHGQGTMQFVDGHTYTGTWHHGCVRQGKYMAWLDATEAECEARLPQ